LSKQTAEKEERARKDKAGAGRPKKSQKRADDSDDFDVGLGFEKFATGNADAAKGGNANDIDDFDFSNVINSKREEGK